MAVNTKPRPINKKSAGILGLILVALAIAVILFFVTVWGGLRGVSSITGWVAESAEQVSDTSRGLSEQINIFGANEFDPEIFITLQHDFVIRPEYLEVSFFIPPYSESPYTNEEIIQRWGQQTGRGYITETGRVNGWELYIERTFASSLAPFAYKSTVEIFETSEGASLALSPDWFWAYTDENFTPDEILDEHCDIGDECILFMYSEYRPASHITSVRYEIAFTYQNTLSWISVRGLDIDVNESHALEAAEIVYQLLTEVE